MNPDYDRGLRDGTYVATVLSLAVRARHERNNALFWFVMSVLAFGFNVAFLTPTSWLGLVVWGVCAAASGRRAWKNQQLGFTLLNELARWKADHPEANPAFRLTDFPAKWPGNNNKGEL